MNSISHAEMRGECPHCAQHFLCDLAAAGQTLRCPACEHEFIAPDAPAPQPAPSRVPVPTRQFRCPRCAASLSLFEVGQNPTDCPRCGWHHASSSSPWKSSTTTAQRAIVGIVLLIIGIASPFLICLSMMLTFVTGPLALVLAPIAGFICGNFLCRTVYDQTGPRWYLFYIGSGLFMPVLIMLWPSKPHWSSSNDFNLGGFAEGLAALLFIAALVLWLVASVYAWFKAHPLE